MRQNRLSFEAVKQCCRIFSLEMEVVTMLAFDYRILVQPNKNKKKERENEINKRVERRP